MLFSIRRTAVVFALWFACAVVQADGSRVDFSALVAQAADVDEAVALVSDELRARRYDIVLTVNHTVAAASVAEVLRPTQVIFARPPTYLERALLRRSKTIGIDLPVKVLVFENADGDIEARYNPIGYLIDRHELLTYDFALAKLRRDVSDVAALPNGLVTVESARSLEETASALRSAISANAAFRIPLELDYPDTHRHNAATLLVFGNPAAGTLLMQTNQEIAIDLPQKFLVWTDHSGKVHITYNDPFFIAERHGVPGPGDDAAALDTRLLAISNALANFAAAGAGTNN